MLSLLRILFGGCSSCAPVLGAVCLADRFSFVSAQILYPCARSRLPRSLGEQYFVFL